MDERSNRPGCGPNAGWGRRLATRWPFALLVLLILLVGGCADTSDDYPEFRLTEPMPEQTDQH